MLTKCWWVISEKEEEENKREIDSQKLNKQTMATNRSGIYLFLFKKNVRIFDTGTTLGHDNFFAIRGKIGLSL